MRGRGGRGGRGDGWSCVRRGGGRGARAAGETSGRGTRGVPPVGPHAGAAGEGWAGVPRGVALRLRGAPRRRSWLSGGPLGGCVRPTRHGPRVGQGRQETYAARRASAVRRRGAGRAAARAQRVRLRARHVRNAGTRGGSEGAGECGGGRRTGGGQRTRASAEAASGLSRRGHRFGVYQWAGGWPRTTRNPAEAGAREAGEFMCSVAGVCVLGECVAVGWGGGQGEENIVLCVWGVCVAVCV